MFLCSFWACFLAENLLLSFYAAVVVEGVLSVTLVKDMSVCPKYHVYLEIVFFGSLTLICLNQMLSNLYTMLITKKYRSNMNFAGVTFAVLELQTEKKLFLTNSLI